MKRFRRLLFWLHLACGVTAGAVILIMSVTGVILALKPQIQNWVDRDIRSVTPQSERLAVQALIGAVEAAKPGSSPQSLTLWRDPALAVTVNLGRAGTVYVNPYTGSVLGSSSVRTSEFFQSVTNWHRYLAMSGESRATGRSLTGISNAAFLVLALSGLYIWWPRQLTRRSLRPIVWFRQTSTGRARDFNWHNTIGFWCLVPIVIMTVSGVVISYPWASDLVYRVTGSPVPVRAQRDGGGAAREGGAQAAVIPAELDRNWARAEAQVPTWSILTMRLPAREGAPVAFTITDGAHWNAFARSTMTVNSATGEVVQWQPYEGNSSGQKVRGWLRFAHTGELGRVPGQIVAGLGSLGGVFLVYTGLSLAFRRLWNWSLWTRVGASTTRRPRTVSATLRTQSAREPALDSPE